MTHTEALNLILSHACASDVNGDVRTFRLDLHCAEVEVTASLTSTYGTIQYEVHTVTIL